MRDTECLPKYWEMLEDDMRETSEFDSRRLKHTLLRQTHYAGRSIILPATDNCVPRERIIAHVARLKGQHLGWQEVAQIYVNKAQWGNGLMKQVVGELIARTPPRTYLFGITSKGSVMKLLKTLQFRPITKQNFPQVEIWAGDMMTDPERLPETALRFESPDPKEGERWLFTRP